MNGKRNGIRPVSVRRAPPEVRVLLRDIQDTMGIPWAPANWRSYAVFPRAMQLFWERLRPAVVTESFLKDSLEITERAYRDVSRWYRPGYRPELLQEELHRLQWELDAFEFGNPQLLIQQAALSRAMAGEVVGTTGECRPRTWFSSYRRPEIQLVEESHSPVEIRELYRDIRETLGLPLVNSDYLALAKWPEFLVPAWQDVKPWLRTEQYLGLQRELARMAQDAADRLCPPVRLDGRELLAAVEEPAQLEELRAAVGIFTDLLPGLILNDAMFRIGAARGEPVEPLQPRGEEAPPESHRREHRRLPAVRARQAAAVVAGALGIASFLAAGWSVIARGMDR